MVGVRCDSSPEKGLIVLETLNHAVSVFVDEDFLIIIRWVHVLHLHFDSGFVHDFNPFPVAEFMETLSSYNSLILN